MLRARPFALSIACAAAATLSACGSDTAPTNPAVDDLLGGSPPGWFAGSIPGFNIGLDRTQRHGGTAAAFIMGTGPAASGSFVAMSQAIRADSYRGKRLRWSGWVKSANVTATTAGLWMRVDGPGVTSAFDNMNARPIVGTSDWHEVSVVLDVAPNAIGIAIGVLFNGTGTLLVDDLRLEVVGTDVPSTTLFSSPQASGSDSASVAATYARNPVAPSNLNFEGLPVTPKATVDWLSSNASTLTTTDPQASLADLAPLERMIGTAHLVGLGEDTHGTREFFQMKHRILEALVKDMGFTTFAIEATSPEANAMNRYVLTGDGDPKVLLSHLYFWTWNTQEVLDMVTWMRQWNTTVPAAKQVRFLGFDMQYPGAAMDSVQAFIDRVDPANTAFVTQRYACLSPYRNRGSSFGAGLAGYAALSLTTKEACAAGLKDVYDLFATNSAVYQASASPDGYQLRVHDARLAQQFEAMGRAGTSISAQSLARDKSMAENIGWIRDQAGPGAKVVLWAHNGHINSVVPFMGGYLRTAYGADYVNLGFLFGQGGFNAVGGNNEGLRAWTATLVPTNSIEAVFSATGKSALLLDARTIASGGEAALPLRGPIAMRSIGAVFSPTSEAAYFSSSIFPEDFDLLIYVNTTTASRLLPFVN